MYTAARATLALVSLAVLCLVGWLQGYVPLAAGWVAAADAGGVPRHELGGGGYRSSGGGDSSDDPYRTWCDSVVPRYDMQEWQQRHGKHELPDHPAIFTGDAPREGYRAYATLERFLAAVGHMVVAPNAEYVAAGGHLKAVADSRRERTSNLDLLARTWNRSHFYISDFSCGEVCQVVTKSLGMPDEGSPGTPHTFQAPKTVSTNFLVGGPDSGLPFHKHGKTWQGLVSGRKGWYIVPPGSMSEELYNLTGPYVIPARGYHEEMQRRRLGQRPLYCVQRPGEVFYVPDSWWHATVNLDAFQLAWGGKPCCFKEAASAEKRSIFGHLPQDPFDTERGCAGLCPGALPNAFVAHLKALRRCDASFDVFDAALGRMEATAKRPGVAEAFAEAAAASHCLLARGLRPKVSEWLRKCGCQAAASRMCTRDAILGAMERWRAAARSLSPSIAAIEC